MILPTILAVLVISLVFGFAAALAIAGSFHAINIFANYPPYRPGTKSNLTIILTCLVALVYLFLALSTYMASVIIGFHTIWSSLPHLVPAYSDHVWLGLIVLNTVLGMGFIFINKPLTRYLGLQL